MSSAPTAETSWKDHLLQQVASHLPPGDMALFQAFFERLLPGAAGDRQALGVLLCDPETVLDLFHFVRRPLEEGAGEEVKVRVTQPRDNGHASAAAPGACPAPGGARVMVHLRDTPFMLGTLKNFLKQTRLTLYSEIHASLAVLRDEQDRLRALVAHDHPGAEREMLLLLLTEPIADDQELARLHADLSAVLLSVKRSVDDFPQMRQQLRQHADLLQREGRDDAAQFTRWIADDNFVFMGLLNLPLVAGKPAPLAAGQGLGIFRGGDAEVLQERTMPGMRAGLEALLGRLTPADWAGV
ncbi:MAG: NAD-glutamate dehydrogenase, partial [Magnetococcus sp. WYHC-3]